MTDFVSAARLDAKGVYQGMDTLPADDLTALHLPQITECDLVPGTARWEADATNPFGGLFVPLQEPIAPNPDAINAIALALVALFKNTKTPCPSETADWLKAHIASFDFKGEM